MEGRKKKGGYSRSLNGCRTCRIRRVKCDEQRPNCRRCSSTGRTCEWFDGSSTPDKQLAVPEAGRAPRRELILHKSPNQLPGVKASELRGFEFFVKRTAPELSYFDGDLWPQLVLQLSRSNEPVLHAAIALGTLHEVEECHGMTISRHRMSDTRHNFAISRYNSALASLANSGPATVTQHRALLLASCLIFIHVELLRGEYYTALKHVCGGLKILQSPTASVTSAVCEIAILDTALKRLDLQLGHFSGEHSAQPIELLDASFYKLEQVRPLLAQDPLVRLIEIRKHCELLSGLTSKLLDNTRNYLRGECCSAHAAHFGVACNYLEAVRPDCGYIETSHIELVAMQSRLINYISEYLGELNELARFPALRRPKPACSTNLLKVHLLAMMMQVRSCLANDVELAYDALDFEMSELLSAAEIFSHKPSCPLWREATRPTLLTDWGIVPPLFHVALKCRDPLMRRRAVEILELWPHREGFWDSALCVAVVRKIMEVEEGGASIEQIQQNRALIARASNVYTIIAEDQSGMSIAYDLRTGTGTTKREEIVLPFEKG